MVISSRIPTIYRVPPRNVQSETCFFNKLVRFGRAKLLLFLQNPLRELLHLGMGSGPGLFKEEGQIGFSHVLFRLEEHEKKERWTKSVNCWSPEL